jgi:hypothetical protein
MRRWTKQRTLGALHAWSALGAGLCALAQLGACQAILGLGDYEIAPPAIADGGAGEGGAGADAGGSPGASGCGGTCDPSLVGIQGVVRAYDTGLPLGGVLVESAAGERTTDAGGQFSLQVPPGEVQALTLNWPASQGGDVILPFRRTVIAFEPGALGGLALDVPVVRHAWLEDLARDCGLLPPDAPASLLKSYFEERNTILVEVTGGGADGITRDSIDVYVERGDVPYSNFAAVDASDPYPPSICFLERGDAGGALRGGTGDQTTALGQFVVFRVRNRNGTGSGTATVRIVNFGSPPSVPLPSAGLTAAVRVGGGW